MPRDPIQEALVVVFHHAARVSRLKKWRAGIEFEESLVDLEHAVHQAIDAYHPPQERTPDAK